MSRHTVRKHVRSGKSVRSYKRTVKLSGWRVLAAVVSVLVAFIEFGAEVTVALLALAGFLLVAVLGGNTARKRSASRRRPKGRTLVFHSGKRRTVARKSSQRSHRYINDWSANRYRVVKRRR